MKKRIFAVFMIFAMLLLVSCSANSTLKIGTGNEGGTYYKYGEKLAELVQNDVDLQIRNTAGSAANARLVNEGFLDFAIVQSDVLNDAYNGKGTFEESGAYKGYSAVSALYTETCQIVVKAESDIKTVADLHGRKVSVGEEESGTLQNATQILAVAGMRISDVDAVYLSFTESAEALKKGEIDAFFCTALTMMPVMSELSASTSIRLISLDNFMIERLVDNYSGYTQTTVPASTYHGQTEDVSTVGVKAVLIAGNDVSADKVQKVLETVFDKSAELDKQCNLGGVFNPHFAVSDVPIPFHEGTKTFYAKNNITVNTDYETDDSNLNVGQDG